METNQSSSKAVPIFIAVVGISLAAATVYSAKTSYELRFKLRTTEQELEELKGGHATNAPTVGTDSLQKRLSESEAAYKLMRESYDTHKGTVKTVPAVASAAATNAPSVTSTNRVSWMERTRQEDPERYKQMMDAREQRRQQVEASFQEQYRRLDERLKTAQTKDEADLINSLADTLTKMNDLRQSWEKIQQLPDDQRREQAQQLATDSWQTYQTYTDLRSKDRQLQLQQLATQIGYSTPKDVSAFIDTVQRINKETDTSMNRFMGGGGGRGGFGQPRQQ